jgi:hypothetical protein
MRFLSSEFNQKTLIWLITTVIGWLPAGAGNTREAAAETAAKIDQTVVSELSSMHGSTSRIIEHIDLTTPFQTKTQWALVIGKEPDEEGTEGPLGDPIGAVSVCFINNESIDCSERMLTDCMGQNISIGQGERLFYELHDSAVVYSGPRKTQPLLMVRTCTMPGVNGNCGVSTFLFDYDQNADRFYNVFFNITGRNNNQETRFIESGPLIGDVIVAEPTNSAPFTYWMEIYKRNGSGKYERFLRYRGKTGYADGNPLAVIDSEMPEIQKHLKLWTPGQDLPVPPKMPTGCTKLFMRNGVEWCE